MPGPSPEDLQAGLRARLGWTLAIALAFSASAASAWVAGRAGRSPAGPVPPTRHAVVRDAGDALRHLGRSGVHGRVLVVLTGRWGALVSASSEGGGNELIALDAATPANALLAAAQQGVARALEVVMTDGAFAARDEALAGARGVTRGPGWLEHPYLGFPRRFSTWAAMRPRPDPAVVVIEPSFLEGPAGGAEDLAARLARRGVRADLLLVALDDPAATDEQRRLARALAEGSP